LSIAGIASRLAQDPRNRINRVVWGDGVSGMLFLYASAGTEATKGSLPAPLVATVRRLPDAFDIENLFADDNEQIDEPDFLKAPGDTHQPITNQALAKFMTWTPYSPINTQKSDAIAAKTFYSWIDPNSQFGPLTAENYQDNPIPGRQSHDSWGVSATGLPLVRWEAAGGGFFKSFPEALSWGRDHGYDTSTGSISRSTR
jgi:hypothetical protein